MSREIKFRVWDSQLKIMIYDPGFLCMNMKGPEFDINKAIYLSQKEDEIWLQYTGLKDKNDEEIYEGDVLIWFPFSFATEPEKIIVEVPEFFEEKGFQEREMGREYLSERLEIIGNIYENPELVK